ncbi:MAG: hypothetical protein AB7O98_00110 [Hyphomonadaceae bacterium]
MVDKNTLDFVMQHALRWVPTTYGPDADLVVLTLTNPAQLQRVLEGIQKDRDLKWPTVADAAGKQQPAQLFIGDSLTVSQLCEIVQSGAWPQSWTRPGLILRAP